MRFRYSPEQLNFLRNGYLSMKIPELTAAFNEKFNLNKKKTAIKTVLTNRKFTCGRRVGNPKGYYSLLTKEQFVFVSENYLELSIPELTKALNKKFKISFKDSQIKAFVTNHNIMSGRTGCFEKGHKPWNNDLKGYIGSNVTSFKKGHVPANFKPVGSERICSKDGIVLVKINEPDPYTPAKTRWKAKHIVVWEKENGKLPKGMVVFFLDGDNLNCDPLNLKDITKGQLLYLNQHSYKDLPNELKPNMIALAMLETKRFDLERKSDLWVLE